MTPLVELGSEAEYGRVHKAARALRKPCCERCESIRVLQCALILTTPVERLRRSPKTGCFYSIDPSDYLTLCIKCHKAMDAKSHCANGHLYTTENSLFKKSGGRECRTCMRENTTRRNATPEGHERKLASAARYRASPEGRANRLAYAAEYRASPENIVKAKAYAAEYRTTPEGRAKNRAHLAKYRAAKKAKRISEVAPAADDLFA